MGSRAIETFPLASPVRPVQASDRRVYRETDARISSGVQTGIRGHRGVRNTRGHRTRPPPEVGGLERLTDAVIDNLIDHCALKLGRVRVDGYHRLNVAPVWGDG